MFKAGFMSLGGYVSDTFLHRALAHNALIPQKGPLAIEQSSDNLNQITIGSGDETSFEHQLDFFTIIKELLEPTPAT